MTNSLAPTDSPAENGDLWDLYLGWTWDRVKFDASSGTKWGEGGRENQAGTVLTMWA